MEILAKKIRVSTRYSRAALSALHVLFLTVASAADAQTFNPVPSLSFTTVFAGANPLPQVVTITSTGAQFNFSATPSTTSGGNWLSVTPTGTDCCITAEAVTVSVNPASLSSGTYTGQIVFAAYGGAVRTITVPVTLTVAAASGTFFDDMPGQASFSMTTGGGTPATLNIPVRNGGSGTLNWTLTASTADGGSWINLPAMSGSAPSSVTVGITTASLPGGGSTAGTFIGQLLFVTAGSSVTVPVSVTVGTNIITQVNPLNFTMPFAGSNPLPQVVSIASPGANFNVSSAVYTGNGGNWLQISNLGADCCVTPEAITVSINASTLPAGTYTGEIVFTEYAGRTLAMTVPVTLTVAASGDTFFDSLPGELSFFRTSSSSPPAQAVPIRNGGTGSLNWTLSVSTADGGNWLTPSAFNGTAPSTLSVGILTSALPGGGLIGGTFNGQLVLETAGDTVTIPVSVVVGTNIFTQVNPITFTMPFAGSNPLPQVIPLASLGANFNVSSAVFTGGGGSWLQISNLGADCCVTPEGITVSINASTVPAGTYTGEIIFAEYAGRTMALTVPVTLTIEPQGAAKFFDVLPGQMSFSMTTKGNAPPAQPIQIRNAGTGTLNWTLSTTTADGGSWLIPSVVSGTAPSTVSVSINPAALPNGGQIAGTFSGQVSLKSGTDVVTIPVTVLVGANVFTQVNALNFTMTVGGANPLPQTVAIASTGTNFNFSSAVNTGSGGSWLTISNLGADCCVTPFTQTVSVNGSTLGVGTYTGEIILAEYAGRTEVMTIPVTLTVKPATAAYFDNLPGQLSFFLKTGGGLPPQTVQVRNAGTGTLNWTVTGSTADGGSWLSVNPPGATAPSTVTVTVTPGNLPGQGLIAGTFNGQLVFKAPGNTVTVPVSVVVGDNVFTQVNGINFTMPAGGANPLPQVITVPSTGSNFNFSSAVSTGNGGNWLTSSVVGADCCVTPEAITVSVNGSGLSPGTYTGEIVLSEYAGRTMSMTVPVTLTVVGCGSFFDNVQGQISFSFAASSSNPPSQSVQIRSAGSGALNWTLSATTADGGKWLTMSSTNGTAPGSVNIGVKTAKLPGGGLVAGSFIGELVLQSSNSTVTIPVSVTVGPNVFSQAAPLVFNMTLGGATPPSQPVQVNSTGANFNFSSLAASGTGGTWLSIAPSGTDCCVTPKTLTAAVNPSGLPAGTYTGEISSVEYAGRTMAMMVPVILNITDPHIPAAIAATSGTPQTATVAKPFGQALEATVTDSGGNPVSGVLVTFNAPASGASGTFACSGNSAVTNASGLATSQVFTANTTAGKYTVTATANALTSNPSFALTNKPGPPASITATSGTPQSATVNTAFATKLAATVTDIYGNAVSGATVTFNAPGSGASGTFAGGVNTAATNAQGIAKSGVFTANTTAGVYTVTATVGAHTTSPGFVLTNLAGPPAAIAATSGTPQNAKVNAAFATNLAATVTDSFNNPVPGASVTFNAPGSGASGTFAGGVNTATTDSQGVATAATLTANSVAGSYTVTATVGPHTTSPGFALTNKAGAAASITATGGTPQSAAINTAFAHKLAATVKDTFGNPVAGATVTFHAPTSGASGTFAGGVNTADTNAQGVATSPTFTANGTVGSYSVTAKVGSLTTSPGYALTNTN
jgi:hypothetical protein